MSFFYDVMIFKNILDITKVLVITICYHLHKASKVASKVRSKT